MSFVWTSDPTDPCPYCVQWDEPEQTDSSNFEDAVPYERPGVPAERVYGYTHDSCEQAVARYVAEASDV